MHTSINAKGLRPKLRTRFCVSLRVLDDRFVIYFNSTHILSCFLFDLLLLFLFLPVYVLRTASFVACPLTENPFGASALRNQRPAPRRTPERLTTPGSSASVPSTSWCRGGLEGFLIFVSFWIPPFLSLCQGSSHSALMIRFVLDTRILQSIGNTAFWCLSSNLCLVNW